MERAERSMCAALPVMRPALRLIRPEGSVA